MLSGKITRKDLDGPHTKGMMCLMRQDFTTSKQCAAHMCIKAFTLPLRKYNFMFQTEISSKNKIKRIEREREGSGDGYKRPT